MGLIQRNNMDQPTTLSEIRELIASDELPAAFEKMPLLLGNDPRLNEAIQQSGRFFNIKGEMRLGTAGQQDAMLTQNQIRWGLLELVGEIGYKGRMPLPQALRGLNMSGNPIHELELEKIKKLLPAECEIRF